MTLDDLQRLLWEFARHRVVTVAARTGLLTLLAQRPATPAEAACELGLDPLATAKVIRALAAIGLVSGDGDRFHVVETLAPLLAGGADDITPFIAHSHTMYDAWGENLEPWAMDSIVIGNEDKRHMLPTHWCLIENALQNYER
jgi:hypothetical protein